MENKQYELRILIGRNRKPIQEYPHQGRVFVEGRRGTEFELEFKNKTGGRLLVVPSVDGLSTLDGSQAGPDSKGYVVKAHDTLIIPGWTLDGQNAAKFLFQDKEKSYAAAMSSTGTTNAGVVGVLVYRENVIPNTPPITIRHEYQPSAPPVWPTPRSPWMGGMVRHETPPSDVSKIFQGPYYTSDASQIHTGAATVMPQNVQTLSVGATASIMSSNTSTMKGQDCQAEPESTFGLGTGWGDKTAFKTNETTFNRGNLDAQLILYYDTRRNLEKRGIEVVKRDRTYLDDLPSPFQGVGCKPPPGWKG